VQAQKKNRNQKKICSRSAQSACSKIFVCVFQTPSVPFFNHSEAILFLSLNKGLNQWPHKQHRYHLTRFLVLTQEQNKILHNTVVQLHWPSSSRLRIVCNR